MWTLSCKCSYACFLPSTPLFNESKINCELTVHQNNWGGTAGLPASDLKQWSFFPGNSSPGWSARFWIRSAAARIRTSVIKDASAACGRLACWAIMLVPCYTSSPAPLQIGWRCKQLFPCQFHGKPDLDISVLASAVTAIMYMWGVQ